MSDGNFVKGRIITESSWGVPPASAMQEINLRSISLKRAVTRKTPDIIRGDRRRFRERPLSKHGTLSIPSYLQYGNLLIMRQAFFNGVLSSTVTVTGATISFTSGTKTIADSANGLAGFAKGDIIFISGAVGALNNGAHGKIVSVTAGSIVVESALTTEAAGASVTLTTTRLLDGTTLASLAFEYEYTDMTTTLRGAKGFRVGGMNLSWKNEDFVEETYELLGKTPETTAATYGTGAPTAAKTSDFMNSLDTDFLRMMEGGAAASLLVTQLDVKGTNNQDKRNNIGATLGITGVRVGSLDVEVDLTMYWDAAAKALQDKVDAETATSLWWAVKDPQGNYMAYSLPALSIEGEPGDISPDADNMSTAKLKAYYDSAWPYMFGVFQKTAA